MTTTAYFADTFWRAPSWAEIEAAEKRTGARSNTE